MKTLIQLALASLILVPSLGHAQRTGANVPDSMSFQGFLADTDGVPYDTVIHLQTRMYKGSVMVWEQGHKFVPIDSGLFKLTLNGWSEYPLDTVAFNAPIDMAIAIGGVELTPRTPLTSVPYAFAIRGMHAVWPDDPNLDAPNLIGGASNNYVESGVVGATISGGGGMAFGFSQADTVAGNWGTVGGGKLNKAGYLSSVAGGNKNRAVSEGSTIGGGAWNHSSHEYSTIGGGQFNIASGSHATVSGGESNDSEGSHSTIGGGRENTATATHSTVAGGWSNDATDSYSTISGGRDNSATGQYSTVAGGQNNDANGSRSTVSGGEDNVADSSYSTVGGGFSNEAVTRGGTIGGGEHNGALGINSTVGGGTYNVAGGTNSTIPGGSLNIAGGTNSFAAGFNALARHNGAFVWADRSVGGVKDTLASQRDNQFVARAAGGFKLFTKSDTTSGVTLPPNTGAWASVSDTNAKTNFKKTEPVRILERLSTVPIQTWRYKGQDESITHMGPTAQDFYSAFGLGIDDKHIVTVDADGVALASIQALHELVKEQQDVIAQLEAANADILARLATLEHSVTN